MADIKTSLRELSVILALDFLIKGREPSLFELCDFNKFSLWISDVLNYKVSLEWHKISDEEVRSIISNGIKLAKLIYSKETFNFSTDMTMKWIGNDTQKGDPIDIVIGRYKFSLKENSFILCNIGLYQFLNDLTNGNYERGLHVFREFALDEYDTWFSYTWRKFEEYLELHSKWELHNFSGDSIAFLQGNNVILKFNDKVSLVPRNIKTNSDYMYFTTSLTREKVFSKWINEIIFNDEVYIKLKRMCSLKAGSKIKDVIENNHSPAQMMNFFQIYDEEYYYGKTTDFETILLKVPARKDFFSNIEFLGCEVSVPGSQLNVLTSFRNYYTNKKLIFRNECRFSHGQFNGTPEAKMYITGNSTLIDLYTPI